MNKHGGYLKAFTSGESYDYKFKVGNVFASSLSGFIAGIAAATIFWIVAIVFLFK